MSGFIKDTIVYTVNNHTPISRLSIITEPQKSGKELK